MNAMDNSAKMIIIRLRTRRKLSYHLVETPL